MPWGKKEPGRHEKPKTESRCGYTWSTAGPNQTERSGECLHHWCGLLKGHPGSHVCMKKWNCGETR